MDFPVLLTAQTHAGEKAKGGPASFVLPRLRGCSVLVPEADPAMRRGDRCFSARKDAVFLGLPKGQAKGAWATSSASSGASCGGGLDDKAHDFVRSIIDVAARSHPWLEAVAAASR